MKFFSILIPVLVMCFVSIHTEAQLDRSPYTKTSNGTAPRYFDVVDLNGDNKQDLVVAQSWRGTDVLIQKQDGSFRLALTIDSIESYLAVCDINGDGEVEIFKRQGTELGYYSIIAKGKERYSPFQAILSDVHGSLQVLIEDVDGDMDKDIVVVSYGGGDRPYSPDKAVQCFFIENTGAKTFVPHGKLEEVADTMRRVVLSDYDGDGKHELMTFHVADDGETETVTMFSYGAKGFKKKGEPLGNIPTYSFRDFIDIDGDGNRELMLAQDDWIAAYDVDQETGITKRWQQEHVFAKMIEKNVWEPLYTIDPCDVDKDGHVDLVVSGGKYKLGIFWNDGTGTFTDFLEIKEHPFFRVRGIQLLTEGSFVGAIVRSDKEIMYRCITMKCLNRPWDFLVR